MKKLLLIFLSVVLTASFVGCKSKEPELPHCTFEPTSMRYTYDEFISTYVKNQENSDTEQTNVIPDLVIPKPKSENFYCTQVELDETYYQYTFEHTQGDTLLVFSKGVEILVSREENSFDKVLDSDYRWDNLIEYYSEDFAHSFDYEKWYINNNGRCIEIDFSFKVGTPEGISNYFEFELVNTSVDTGNTQ